MPIQSYYKVDCKLKQTCYLSVIKAHFYINLTTTKYKSQIRILSIYQLLSLDNMISFFSASLRRYEKTDIRHFTPTYCRSIFRMSERLNVAS